MHNVGIYLYNIHFASNSTSVIISPKTLLILFISLAQVPKTKITDYPAPSVGQTAVRRPNSYDHDGVLVWKVACGSRRICRVTLNA